MRVTAKPPRSTTEISVDIGSASLVQVGSAAPAQVHPVGRDQGVRRESPEPAARASALPSRGSHRGRLGVMVLVGLGAAALITILVDAQDRPAGVGPSPTSSHSGPPPTPSASSTAPTSPPSPTTDPSPATSGPAATPPESGPPPVDGAPSSWGALSTVAELVAIGLGLLVIVVMLVRQVRRRAPRAGVLRLPESDEAPAAALRSTDQPRASLGTPDVLVLTESSTDVDARLHERVRDQEQAIFANLQLACSFHPTDEWMFSGARLTVILARVDGLAAPAPIAYSLLPLLDHDGSAREHSVDIGADMKFVSVKGGEKSTVPGEVFVRGYGLQESVSYWEFTATPHRPLQGSFLLWLIARAPRDSDLEVTSTLQVRVTPRRMWSRADRPSVIGVGQVALTLGLKDGPPYSARLGGSSPHTDTRPWLVESR